jgi:hypothetical protein
MSASSARFSSVLRFTLNIKTLEQSSTHSAKLISCDRIGCRESGVDSYLGTKLKVPKQLDWNFNADDKRLVFCRSPI